MNTAGLRVGTPFPPARPAGWCRARTSPRDEAACPPFSSPLRWPMLGCCRLAEADQIDASGWAAQSAERVAIRLGSDSKRAHGEQHARLPGLTLDRLDPFRFGEVGRHIEPLVLDDAFGRQSGSPPCISSTTSGLPSDHPSEKAGSRRQDLSGRRCSAPPAAHAASVSRSAIR